MLWIFSISAADMPSQPAHSAGAAYAIAADTVQAQVKPKVIFRASEQDSFQPQTQPDWFHALGSYGRNVLFWRVAEDVESNAKAVLIERREQNETSWRLVTPEPISGDRWFDDEVKSDHKYFYQALTVRDGTRGQPTAIQTAIPRDPAQSSLPVYYLVLSELDRQSMLNHPRQNEEINGQFCWKDKSSQVKVRLHGASTRLAQKKSYRIAFLDESPCGRSVTYLKGEPMDHTFQQEKLSCDLFRSAGAWVSQADYVNLYINGHYEGVYVDIEPVRAPFKKNPGLDPNGTLIRANTFQHLNGKKDPGELRGNIGSLDQLNEFIRQINRTDRGAFESWIRRATDWERVRDYLALQVLCHRLEIEANDYFFYQAPRLGRWSFIPWDHNNGNFGVDPYKNRMREPFISPYSQAIQEVGWRSDYWFVLLSRIYQDDALRFEYLSRLSELTTAFLLSGKVDAMIDSNYERLRQEYVVDPYRVPFEGEDPFLRSARDLKQFARRHGKRLQKLIKEEQIHPPAALVVNEFAFGSESGWIELHNRSSESISLKDCFLVLKAQDRNWQLPLSEWKNIGPNGYLTISCQSQASLSRLADNQEQNGMVQGVFQDAGSDTPKAIPGFSSQGGFLGLARRSLESARDHREELYDFWFYGPQSEGRSYGRLQHQFTDLEPTPGLPNKKSATP